MSTIKITRYAPPASEMIVGFYSDVIRLCVRGAERCNKGCHRAINYL